MIDPAKIKALGYHWPADDEPDAESRRETVIELAITAACWWRRQYEEATADTSGRIAREREYQHMQRRNAALAKRLRNLRKAAAAYMRRREFAVFELTRDLIRERKDNERAARRLRRTWLRTMGLDADEIAANCSEVPPTDVDEERAQYEAVLEIRRMNRK